MLIKVWGLQFRRGKNISLEFLKDFTSSCDLLHAHHPNVGEISLQVCVTSDVAHTWTGQILKNKHVSSLEDLAAAQKEGLEVNRQKVQLVQQEVKYLGAIQGIEGQAADKQCGINSKAAQTHCSA